MAGRTPVSSMVELIHRVRFGNACRDGVAKHRQGKRKAVGTGNRLNSYKGSSSNRCHLYSNRDSKRQKGSNSRPFSLSEMAFFQEDALNSPAQVAMTGGSTASTAIEYGTETSQDNHTSARGLQSQQGKKRQLAATAITGQEQVSLQEAKRLKQRK